MSSIQKDMKVRYRSDPNTVGLVIDVSGETAKVFIDGVEKIVPIKELVPIQEITELSPEEFRVVLTQRRLEHPATDHFLSYKASRTNLMYHQFLPVKKMLESPDQRLLIADEVGTGKTIEAGLIWAELETRAVHGLENVWIVCPKSLVEKWQYEMLRRFDLHLELLTSEGIRSAFERLGRGGILPPRFARSIVNLELIRRESHMSSLIKSSVDWDLVIFDEAHHLRNTNTVSHRVARFICKYSKVAVFLTATPIQTHLQDIVHIMEALGVDVAQDPELLEKQLRWDMQLNDWIRLVKRSSSKHSEEAVSTLDELERSGGHARPGWSRFRQLVYESDMKDIKKRINVVESARSLQVLDPYMTRTRRSEVDVDRPVREARTRKISFNTGEKEFYNEMYRICLKRAQDLEVPPGFFTQMPERRTSSCVPAVASEILRYASKKEGDDARFTDYEISKLEPLARVVLGSKDGKLDALLKMLAQAFEEIKADRVMIFSTFTGTLRYLAKKLTDEGYSLELIYGLTPVRDKDCRQGQKSRERIALEFRQGKFQILLASEVAGEGLDFEHCHVVINYDLPWNPMRVEQRIGRCDRIGQKSDRIYIRSLASEGTIEARILVKLYERLGIFKKALGDLEVVLGEAISSFERDLFRQDLKPEEQEARLEQIAEAIEKNSQLKEDLTRETNVISKQGRALIDSDRQAIQEAESRFLSPSELREFTLSVLGRHLPNNIVATTGDLQFDVIYSRDLQGALLKLMSHLSTHTSRPSRLGHLRYEIAQFAERMEQQRRLKVSFDVKREEAEFIHLRHPLMLLTRHLAREQLPDMPWCKGTVPPKMLDSHTTLVWAIGSLVGYATKVELLCAAIDNTTKKVHSVTVERAQELLNAMSAQPHNGTSPDNFNIEFLKKQAEKFLRSEFNNTAALFDERNKLLTERAERAISSHAERQINRNKLRLNSSPDPRIRNMYIGWNQRIEKEANSQLAEVKRKSEIRSPLVIIGMAVLWPMSESSDRNLADST